MDLAASLVGGLLARDRFDDLEAYCNFIGTPRSGHSIVGALLNAHPEAVIAHELGAFRYVARGYGRRQLFWLLLRRDRAFSAEGWRSSGYDYHVPGQWQGRFRRLRVIGDKRGGHASRWLRRHPDLLARLRRTVGLPLRLVHVVRNPFDNIATMARWSGESLEATAGRYFEMLETAAGAAGNCDTGEFIQLRHEEFLEDPGGHLERLCARLGLDCPGDYRRDCVARVFPSPTRPAARLTWPVPLVDDIVGRMQDLPCLRGYPEEP